MKRSFRYFIFTLFALGSFILSPATSAVAAPGDPELLLQKSLQENPNTVQVGDIIHYRILFECSSLTVACGEMEITDVLPKGVRYVPAPESSVPAGFTITSSYDSGTDRDTVTIRKIDNILLDGTQFDATIAARVNYDVRLPGNVLENTVNGWIKPAEPTGVINATPADGPDIAVNPVIVNWNLTKTQISPGIDPTVDTDVTYAIRFCPTGVSGNVAMSNIVLTDTLPTGAVFRYASDGGTESSGTVTWPSVTGPIVPPDCITRYVTVQYPSSVFGHPTTPPYTNVMNTADVSSSYLGNSGWCPNCLTETSPVTHPIIEIYDAPTFSKDDTGDPVGMSGTARFLLNLNTNGTNWPSNNVTLIDSLPGELQVTEITSGTWDAAFNNVRAVIAYSTDLGNTWTNFPGQPVQYNTNATYAAPAPNVTNVRWTFEYDDPVSGTNNIPGLPYMWSFSSAPQVRVTPRAVATTADDAPPTPLPAAVAGATYNNCLQITYDDSDGNPVSPACDIEPMTVRGDVVSLNVHKNETPGEAWDDLDDPNINNFVPDGSIMPGDTLRYTLTVEMTERSSTNLLNFTVTDTLPADLTFVRFGEVELDGVALPTGGLSYTTNPPGPTLTWNFTGSIAPLPFDSHTITMTFYARIPRGQSFGPRTNNMSVNTGTVDAICEPADGVVRDCNASDGYDVERTAALRGEKWIRSTSLANSQVVRAADFLPDATCPNGGTAGLPSGGSNPFTRYPCIAQAYPEGALSATQYVGPPSDPLLDDFEYNLRIFNDGNVPMIEYALYDLLPRYGDTGSGGTLTNAPRDSQFRPALTGPVTFISGAPSSSDFTIEYNTSVNACRPEVFNQPSGTPNVPPGCSNAWVSSVSDWSTVRAYRIVMNTGSSGIPNGGEVRFGVPMQILADAPPTGFDSDDAQSKEIAWNSFAHVGSYTDVSSAIRDLLASEPRKVGITVPERFSLGNRVWRDSDNSGTINPADNAAPGIDGVAVNLYLSSNTTTPIATTTTSNGGYYLFSNLPAGDYVVGIDASNFNSGNPLYQLRSSTGTPPSATYTNPSDNNVDSADHGIDTAAPFTGEVFSPTITLSSNSEPTNEADLSGRAQDGLIGASRGVNGERNENSNLTVDFGFFGGSDVAYSIGNHLWHDNGAGANLNNGIFDSDETAVVGARVELYRDGNNNGRIDSGEFIRFDETDTDGFYLFDNLDPGNYLILVAPVNFQDGGALAGWYSSQPTFADNVDQNDNGINTNFPEVDGVLSNVVTLTAGGIPTGEAHLSNDSSTAPGFNPTGGDGPGHIGRFGETDATSDMTIDFGFIPPMSLGNRVWIDDGTGGPDFHAHYNDGLQNAFEPGRSGVKLELYAADGSGNPIGAALDTTTTDANGYYLFERLQPGNYVVRVTPDNFTSGGALSGYISSFGDYNDDGDMNDNGIDNANPTVNGVVSRLITMMYGTEPLTPADETDIPSGYGPDGRGNYGQADADSNLTVDFGFVRPPYSIGNRVWFDADNSGTINPADGVSPGIGGVTVNLYASFDTTTPIETTTTDVNGYYLFGNLPPGQYVVGIPSANFNGGNPLHEYISSTGNPASATYLNPPVGNPDSADHGINPTPTQEVFSAVLNLTGGQPTGETDLSGNPLHGNPGEYRGSHGEADNRSNLQIDFGFNYAYSIGNRVWYDTNNNSLIDGAEVGVGGVTVQLYAANASGNRVGPALATTTTDASGYYLFDYLGAGNYVVVIPNSNFAAGRPLEHYWSSGTTHNAGAALSDSTTLVNANNNGDSDDDGVTTFNAGAINYVASGLITLGPGVSPEPTGETDLAAGVGQGAQPDGRANMTVDFGFYTTTLGNLVWMDTDRNGAYDSGTEVGVPNVAVELYAVDSSGNPTGSALATTTTDSNGNYSFSGLPEGSYIVRIVTPTGTVSTVDTANSADTNNPNTNADNNDNGVGVSGGTVNSNVVTIAPGDAQSNNTVDNSNGSTTNPTIDFGLAPVFSLGNRVWYDTNNNSSIDGAEVGVDGVTVQLFAADSSGNPTGVALDTQTTANGGYYLFNNLYEGNYVVVLPASNFSGVLEGYWSSGTTMGGAGVVSEAAAALANSDTDSDDNGALQTSGAFNGAVISSVATLGPTLNEPENETDLNGALPGNHQGQPDNQANMTVDFGFYRVEVGNLVYLDNNLNGNYEAGDTVLPNVSVHLFAADGVTEIRVGPDGILGTADDDTSGVTTNASGEYLFSGLPQGQYIVKVTTPSGTKSTIDTYNATDTTAPDTNANNNDNGVGIGDGVVASNVVTLTPGSAGALTQNTITNATGTTYNPTVDFGFVGLVAIGNRVWIDSGAGGGVFNNGIMDGGEVGINGVTVELRRTSDNSLVASTTTSGDGYYQFDNLYPGDYYVVVTANNFQSGGPLETYYSSSGNGTNETSDENADENGIDNANPAVNGIRSINYTLTPGGEPTSEGQSNYTGSLPDASVNFTADFGFVRPMSIGNRVWIDNGSTTSGLDYSQFDDGVQNGDEAGRAGVTLSLYYDLNGDGTIDASEMATPYRTTTTDANGYYLFDLLPEGRYYVLVDHSNFASGGALFGHTSSSGANGDKTIDLNDNGVDDASYLTNGIRSADFVLAYGAEPTGETDLSGNPSHGNAGEYRGVNGERDENSNLTIDFGFVEPPHSLGNRLWYDVNNNGIDDSEAPVVNASVSLYLDADNNGVPDGPAIKTTTTDANGYYLFDNLPAERYIVGVDSSNFQSGGALHEYSSSTGDTNGTDKNDNGIDVAGDISVNSPTYGILSDTVNLTGSSPTGETVSGNSAHGPDGRGNYGETDLNSDLTVDFGFVKLYSLGNRVWFDTDNSHTINGVEVGIDGVTVQLFAADSSGNPVGAALGTTTTANGGYYRFDDLIAGNYIVVLPNGNFTGSGALVGYWSSGTSIDAAGILTDGYARNPEGVDGSSDSLDNGASVFTNSGDIKAGGAIQSVASAVVTLGDYEPTTDADYDPTNPPGEAINNHSNRTVDFGFYTASIGDQVFVDVDEDGKFGSVDLPLPGATVELLTKNGDVIATTTADASGNYVFEDLPAGEYKVRVTPPSGYSSTKDDADTTTPNNYDNNNDNGVGMAAGAATSEAMELKPGAIRPGSPADNAIIIDDSRGATYNPTLDFGFIFNTSGGSSNELSKALVGTSEAHTSGSNVAIGEILDYEIRFAVPVGTLTNVSVVDVPDVGLAFVDCLSVTLPPEITSAPSASQPAYTGFCDDGVTSGTNNPLIENNGGKISFYFGDLTNSDAGGAAHEVIIRYQAVVLDIAANANGVERTNNVSWMYSGQTKTVKAPKVKIVEPDMSVVKDANPKISDYGSAITFTMDVEHTAQSTAHAYDVEVNDPIPAGFTYIPGSAVVTGTTSGSVITFDSVTNTLTVRWDEFNLGERARISFQAVFVGPAPVINTTWLEWTSLPLDPSVDNPWPTPDVPQALSPYNPDGTERWYDPNNPSGVNGYGVTSNVEIRLPKKLPLTGFAPNQVTVLPQMPRDYAYAPTDFWVEIPALKLKTPIVGVPINPQNGEWDLKWLADNIGWLDGTAYPTHNGNSLLTAHSTLASGLDGPFSKLDSLRYGDQIIVHLGGQKYVYEVRSNATVKASAINSVIKHEEKPWLTLITCKTYDEKSAEYLNRTVVRAVLINVSGE